jgi:hypothetical protein
MREHPKAKGKHVLSGLKRRLPHGLWAARGGAVQSYHRTPVLDLDDALAMKWVIPPTGNERFQTAVRLFEVNNDFLLSRLLALQAIAAFRDEGDPRGVMRCMGLLAEIAEHDGRSDANPLVLCNEPIVLHDKSENVNIYL